MKTPLLSVLLLLAIGSWAMAMSASEEVKVRAAKLEKRVSADLSKGTIDSDQATKFTQELDHIHNAMVGQNSTTAERRGMREEMDRIQATLDAAEQGTTGAGSSLPSPTP